jgi:hypothetical protein
MKTLPLRLLVLLSPVMVACSSVTTPDMNGSPEPSAEQVVTDSEINDALPVAEEKPIEYGNFTQEQLETALLSEFGGMRGYLPQATQGYYDLAIETGDINIIRRASEFVSASGNTEA